MIVGGDLLLNCWALNKYLDVSGFQPSPHPLRSARSILEGTTFSKAMKKKRRTGNKIQTKQYQITFLPWRAATKTDSSCSSILILLHSYLHTVDRKRCLIQSCFSVCIETYIHRNHPPVVRISVT